MDYKVQIVTGTGNVYELFADTAKAVRVVAWLCIARSKGNAMLFHNDGEKWVEMPVIEEQPP